jgi:predicted PurR-regulated permease PerM
MIKNVRWIEQAAGLALIGAIVFGCWVVLRPFLSPILWAAILCSTTWPLHETLMRKLRGRRTVVAALMTLLLALAILTPFVIAAFTFTASVQTAVTWLHAQSKEGLPPPPMWVDRIPWVGHELRQRWLHLAQDIRPAINSLLPWLEAGALWLLDRGFDVAKGVLQLTLSIMIAFFFYRDGHGIVRRIREGLQQISGNVAGRLLDVAETTTRSVVYGIFGSALIQACLAGLGFFLLRVPSSLTLAVLTFLADFLPFGATPVWVGVTIWQFSTGETNRGIIMLLYGSLIINGAEHLIRPLISSRGAHLSFITMFIGILGGLSAFGFAGLFLGPTILAVGYALAGEVLESQRLRRGITPDNPE